MARSLLLLLSCLALASSASAGQGIDFFRTTCLPQAGYFSIEHKPIDGANVFWGKYATPEGQSEALAAWKENGFHEGSFEFSCEMTQGVYTAKVSRSEFSERRCGAAPQIRLTLTLDDAPVLSDVVFGTDCWGNHSVSSVEIVEGHAGWASTDMTLCFYKKGFFPRGCDLVSQAYWSLGSTGSVDQRKVDAIVEALDRQ